MGRTALTWQNVVDRRGLTAHVAKQFLRQVGARDHSTKTLAQCSLVRSKPADRAPRLLRKHGPR